MTFSSILEYLHFRLATTISPQWKPKNYHMQSVRLTNKALAKDLEIACKKKDGILTYAEYLAIEQFGKHGYHAAHNAFGRTGTHQHWPQAVVSLCKKNGYKHVVEFGSGDATLGIAIAKRAQKENVPLVWSGVEINTQLQKQTIQGFKSHRLESFFGKVVASFKDLSIATPCLVVFSYSLDSIPPEIFINTKQSRGVPDTIVGVIIKNGILTERILTKEELHKKGLPIKNGIVSKKSGNYDLRSWQLYPWQRAYISLQAFALFQDAIKYVKKDATFLIIDEFRPSTYPWETNHRCVPRSLYRFQREPKNIVSYYEQAGKNLLYYPIHLYTMITLLNSVGCSSIYDIEQKMAREICDKVWIPLHKTYFTYAFLATKTEEKISRKTLIIGYPERTLF